MKKAQEKQDNEKSLSRKRQAFSIQSDFETATSFFICPFISARLKQ